MKIKKLLIKSIWLLLLPLCFTSCSDEWDYKDLSSFTVIIIELYNDTPDSTFRYTFNNDSLAMRTYHFGSEPTKMVGLLLPSKASDGTLRIFKSNSTIPILEEAFTLQINDTIRTIILNDGAYLYTPEAFPSVTVNVSYQTGQSDFYSINYLGNSYEQIIANGLNYVAAENSNGTLQMVRKSDDIAVFSKSIRITDGTRIDLLQLSEDVFLDMTIPANEPDPVDANHTKLRFYLDAAINTEGDEARMLIYNAEGIITDTLDFDPATSASPFTEIDINSSYKYEVYKLSDMTKLVSKRTVSFKNTGEWKFQTLKAAKYSSTFMDDLSVKW